MRTLALLLPLVACQSAGAPAQDAGTATRPSLAYDDTGPASGADETLLLVHGWSCDRRVWDDVLDPLAPEYRVLAVDLPGHGESPPADSYSMDATADALAEFLDALDIERCVLIGHSNGTSVVRQFERRYPQRTRGLVTVDGALRPMMSPEQVRGFAGQLRGPDYLALVEPMVENMLPRSDPEARDLVREVMLSVDPEVMARTLEASADPAIWTEDPIGAPLLVVQADAPFWTDDYEAFVRDLAPGARYHVVPDVSHFVMLDAPETFRELVSDFLAALQSGQEPHE